VWRAAPRLPAATQHAAPPGRHKADAVCAPCAGGLNVCFQLCITVGILIAQLVNYGVQDWDDG
jgi:hypothetical protein